MVHYLDTQELLMDLLEELSNPFNTKWVLDRDVALRDSAQNLVAAFKARRLDVTRLCGCDPKHLLYKYCKHRVHASCDLKDEDCPFSYPPLTGLDKERKVIWPCAECGGDAWHREDCSIGHGKSIEEVNP